MANPERKTRGRQKVAMVRMEKESNRLVTFSKRRSGLFKKASELCTLCGTEAVIIVFSPGRKAFSFGHPSVDTIINRYYEDHGGSNNGSIGHHQISFEPNCEVNNFSRFNMELTLLNNRFEVEKKHNEELIELRKSKGEDLWWLDSVEALEFSYLKQLDGPISSLRNDVLQFGSRLILEATNNTNSVPCVETNRIISDYFFPPDNVVGRDNLFEVGGQFLGSNPVGRDPNDHPPIVMIPTPTPTPGVGFGDPGLPMGVPNAIWGYDAPNVPSFQGANNFIEGQLDATLMPFMGMDPQMSSNLESFTSLLMNPNSMDAPNVPPFNPQGEFEFGFGPRFY